MKDLRKELVGVLDLAVPFETSWQILCSLKQRGAKADDVQSALEAMYQESAEESAQERIADLLDRVVGWCAPQYAVWKD